MATYTTNYNLEKPEASDPFGDFRQSYNANMDIIDANLGGGGGSGGHTILDGDGNSLPQEDDLQFTGACSVTDDNVNGATVVDIKGGYILNAQRYSTDEIVIGVWTDNKPLYQKTWYVPKSSLNSGETTYTHGDDLHIENLVSVEGAVGNTRPLVEYHSNSVWACSIYNIGNNAFWIYLGSSVYSNMSNTTYVKVTLRYTKTTDTAGSGGYEAYGFSPVIYSDNERKIGVWRNNKPLYAKTVHINALPDSAHIGQYVVYPHGISDIDEIIDYEGIIHFSNGTSLKFVRLGFTVNSFTPSSSIDSYCNSTDIRIMCGSDRSSANADYTILYTKTTDVAGSGDYNTYGVPTVHYSTSEQVIGTWLDGRPIYQKTINFGALPNNESKKVNHNIANVKRIWIYDGYAFNSVSGYCNQLNLSGTANISSQWYSGCNSTFVEVRPNSDRTAYDECYITVRYTKTTD